MDKGLVVLLYQLGITLNLIFAFHTVIVGIVLSILNTIVKSHNKIVKIPFNIDEINSQSFYPSDWLKSFKGQHLTLMELIEGLKYKNTISLTFAGKILAIISIIISTTILCYYYVDLKSGREIVPSFLPLLLLLIPLAYWFLLLCVLFFLKASMLFLAKCLTWLFNRDYSYQNISYVVSLLLIIVLNTLFVFISSILEKFIGVCMINFSAKIRNFIRENEIEHLTPCMNCSHHSKFD